MAQAIDPASAAPRLDVEALYVDFSARVYAFAFRMLGDRDAALDVVQETYAVALAGATAFRGEAAPLTWLISIARNLCLKRARNARERTFLDFETLIERHAKASSSTHSDAERRFYLEEVKQGCLVGLLQCLPVSQRSVFVLHILNDVPTADIALIMGKSPNSIRILLSRARARMREFLCRNCSLMGGSTCECENMIDFSLSRQLIERYRPEPGLQRLEAELRRFAGEVELYRSLPDATAAIAEALQSKRFTIFTSK